MVSSEVSRPCAFEKAAGCLRAYCKACVKRSPWLQMPIGGGGAKAVSREGSQHAKSCKEGTMKSTYQVRPYCPSFVVYMPVGSDIPLG